jgi:AsmA protein
MNSFKPERNGILVQLKEPRKTMGAFKSLQAFRRVLQVPVLQTTIPFLLTSLQMPRKWGAWASSFAGARRSDPLGVTRHKSRVTSHVSLCYPLPTAHWPWASPSVLEDIVSGKLRTILIIVGVLVVLLLIAPFLIPVNQFRPTIEDKASAALGRKVQLGNLSLSLLSGSLSAEDLSIGDDPKFSSLPFLKAKSLKVGVEIMPLIFSKTLNVTGITIDSPQVTLLHNGAGQWNYSSLGGSAAKSAARQTPSDKTSSSSNSSADLTIKKLELKVGSIIVGSTNSQKRSTYDHVTVTATEVSMASKFPLTVTADLPGGGKFKLDGTVGPIDQADTSLTPLDAKMTASSLNLATTGFLDPSAGLGGIVDLDSTIASQNGVAETNGNLKLSKALLIAGGAPSGVPLIVDFNTKYNLRKNAGVLNPSTVKIGSAVSHLNGTYDSAGEATVVNIKLSGKDMPAKDLEAFLPALGIHLPKGASLEGGTLNADLNLTGPTNKMVTTGTVGLFNAKLVGFDLGSKMSAISSLTGVKTGKDLNIEKLTTNLRMAPDGLKADNFVAVVPSLGNLAGGGTIDSKNNLDFKMAATLTGAIGAVGSPVGDATGMLGKLTGGAAGGGCKGGTTTVPFLIQGTTADPKFIPDVGGLAAGMLKSQLGCAGGATAAGAQAAPTTTTDAIGALGGLLGKKKKP